MFRYLGKGTSKAQILCDHGGGQVVSVQAFYSDDPSSKPAVLTR